MAKNMTPRPQALMMAPPREDARALAMCWSNRPPRTLFMAKAWTVRTDEIASSAMVPPSATSLRALVECLDMLQRVAGVVIVRLVALASPREVWHSQLLHGSSGDGDDRENG